MQNLIVGSIYIFGGFFAFMTLLAVFSIMLGMGGTDTGSDTVAEADTNAPADETEQAAENEVSDDGANADETEEAAESEVSDDDANADEGEAEAETESEPAPESEPSSESQSEPETMTDGGVEAEAPAAAPPAESAVEETDEYDGAMSPELMEIVIENEGIDVDVSERDGLIVADYTGPSTVTEEQLAGDLGAIAGAYTAMVADGYPTEGLEINVYAADGTPVGYTTLDAADAQAWHDGEMSDDEFALKILDENLVAYNA